MESLRLRDCQPEDSIPNLSDHWTEFHRACEKARIEGYHEGRNSALEKSGYFEGYADGFTEARKQIPPPWWRDGAFFVIGLAVSIITFLFL